MRLLKSFEQKQFAAALAGAVAVLLVGLMLATLNEARHRRQSLEQVSTQAGILARGVSAALAFDDPETVREYVNALAADPELAAAGVYDETGALVLRYAREGAASPPERAPATRTRREQGAFEVALPVTEQGTRLGAVYLRTAAEPAGAVVGRHGALGLLMIMAVLVIGLLTRAGAELRARAADLIEANAQLRREMEERAKVEEALRQSQKMESLGQLTGGVAHDFNNLLTIIIGGLETIERHLPQPEGDAKLAKLHRARDMAMHGAHRAATLTKRLLAFSRQQPLEPKPADLNKMVSGMAELMRRTLGETVALETVMTAGLWRTQADHSQLENALLNLAVNARDAMPGGGRLTIETQNAYLDEAYVAQLPEAIEPGQYVLVAVTDTGTGMSKETLERVFEPFFTTKEVGKGTGLGLSQVYGFVRQSGGHIRVYSELGEGTTVKIYLPRVVAAEDAPEATARRSNDVLVGDETVLVVEDHDELRGYSAGILRELGYQVYEAADARQALEILAERPDIVLLFTDVVLPGGMNGRKLADAALVMRPDLRVLFTTGYTRNAIVHNGKLDAGVHLISKPFSFEELGAKVRQVLDQADAAAAPPLAAEG